MYFLRMTLTRWLERSPSSSKIALTLALVGLCGCSSVPPKEHPQSPAAMPPAPVLPPPAPLKLENVTWRVTSSGDGILFGLDSKNYEALSRNLAELTTWIREATWQLDFYRRHRDAITPADGAK